jgi:putative hydrolase of the HAD superfamily
MTESQHHITTLFLDFGGVLLTNGWDHNARRQAAKFFNLDYEDMEQRHNLTFDTYEEGKLSLHEYLQRVVFYEKRLFSPDEFHKFMYSVSRPFSEMINLVRDVKALNRLKVVGVSNEGRELAVYRIKTFNMREYIDAFVCSAFIHTRKPDVDFYRIALDISQVAPEEVVYLDDRSMFVDVARSLGINGIHHTDYHTTRKVLVEMGLELPEEKTSNEVREGGPGERASHTM